MSLIESKRSIHFVGIGGIGMSGLAELLLKLGHKVSGSDLNEGESVEKLKAAGALFQLGHKKDILEKNSPDVVVYSTAVKESNPELLYARQARIPVIRRAEMLAELMRLKRGIAIAGSHGKTTTTGLVSLILKEAGLDPTVVIGGRFDAIGSNAAWGRGAWLVAEADESDGSFLRLSPEISVVTNIDREHLDFYKNFENELKAFEDFLDRLPFYGRAIICSDCPHVRALSEQLKKPYLWYGLEKEHKPDFWLKIIEEGANPVFEVYEKLNTYSTPWLRVRLQVPGRHNILNAAAAALVARELEIPADVISKALGNFSGVQRRFQLRGSWRGHPVIEDYAHHPTEIRATLAAAKSVYKEKKPIVMFQPHRYSRTRDLWTDFSTCFQNSSLILSLPIYAAAEAAESWVRAYDGVNFAKNVSGTEAQFVENATELLSRIVHLEDEKKLVPGAPIFVLGAGDIAKIIPKLLAL